VLAAFSLGYAVAQIPGGALADRFGAKILLIASPILWSVFTGMTGFVASFIAFAIVRVLFGLAEGLSNGASFRVN
jgi:MFS family permease